MKLYGKIVLIAVIAVLAGCQGSGGKSGHSASVDPEADRCGASDYQRYVGKPLSSIDGLRFEHPVRAIPYNSAVTMDFNLNRLNFMADSQGNITRAYCG